MSKSKVASVVAGLLLGVWSGLAGAQTYGDLSVKNRELLQLKADIELARRKAELKKELAAKPDKDSSSASSTGAAGKQPTSSPADAVPVETPRPVPVAVPLAQTDVSVLGLKAVYGDENNPFVEFTYQGVDRPAIRQGEMVIPSWRLRAVNGRAAVIEKLGKTGKIVATRTLMLPSTVAPAAVSRYDAVPALPAVAIPRLPDLGPKR